jgi:hypothetical protein
LAAIALLTVLLVTGVSDAARAQARNMRLEILDRILSGVVCCSDDQRFSKPASRSNIRESLGIAIGEAGVDDTIHIGAISRAPDGALALSRPYLLDRNCKPVPINGPALKPVFPLFAIEEIAARSPKDSPEQLWPIVNAAFQSTLLTILKHQAPVNRYTCMRRHLERLIHGEPG